jgi:hypothetical protein
MYDEGKLVNFPGTLMAYKPKVASIKVKLKAGVKGKRRIRARDGKLLSRSAPLDLN